VGRYLVIEIDQVGAVLAGEHKEVTRRHGIDVHDRHHDVILVDVVRREITAQDGAEDAELGGFVGVIAHGVEGNP
jgi:predicted Zn-dependent protease